MESQRNPIDVIGAGPAGLAAAILLARAGRCVVVHEQRNDAGARFHGDFQAFQNWVWKEDTLDMLRAQGLDVRSLCHPFRELTAYVGRSRSFRLRADRPFFYLVRRGTDERSLDQGLKRQAESAGVEFQWNHRVSGVETRPAIVATGPKGANILAKCAVFETGHPDDCLIVIDNELAPRGYAYLIVFDGQATLATCFFGRRRDANALFRKTVDRFREIAGIESPEGRSFGGYGHFYVPLRFTDASGLLYAGESAGLIDYLWGFGLHNAILSGALAAKSILADRPYALMCGEELTPLVRASLVNRWLYGLFSEWLFPIVLTRMEKHPDYVFSFLRRFYGSSRIKELLFPVLARFSSVARIRPSQATEKNARPGPFLRPRRDA